MSPPRPAAHTSVFGDDVPLDVPMTVCEVAKHCGRSAEQLLHWLKKIQEKHPEVVVLQWWGRRPVVPSLAALHHVWPDLGKKFYRPEDVESLERENADRKRENRALAARLRKLEDLVQAQTRALLRRAEEEEQPRARRA